MLNFFTKRLNRKNKKGFTLIELIVVIAIVAVLAAIGIPAIAGQVGRSQLAAAVGNAKLIAEQGQIMFTDAERAGRINPAGGGFLNDGTPGTVIASGAVTHSTPVIVAFANGAGVNLGGGVTIAAQINPIEDTDHTGATIIVGYSVDEVIFTAPNGVEGTFTRS